MSAKQNRSAPVVLGGEPRVDLLPPEVHANAKFRSTRRVLGLLVILTLVLVAGGYGAALIHWLDEGVQLRAAEARTSELLTEQGKYADASRIAANLAAGDEARALAFSNEILWSDLVDDIIERLPEGAVLESATMDAREPWAPAMEAQGPLRAPRVANIVFIVSSPSLLDTSAIIRRLTEIEGFADASPDRVDRKDTVFETTITLNLSEEALNDRFGEEEAEK